MKLFSTLLILTMFSCKMKGLEKTAGIESYIVSDLVQNISKCDTTPANPVSNPVIIIVGGGCGDGQTKGAAVFNPGFIEDSGIAELNYGGETGCLGSKAYKEAMRKWERDTIIASDLDLSVTYSDTKNNFIIYGGEVFFRADVVGEEKRAKEVLGRFKEMQDRANRRANNIPDTIWLGNKW